MKNVGVLLIATGKYNQFVKPLIQNLHDHFLKNSKVTVFLFTDDVSLSAGDLSTSRINILITRISSLKYPYATLYRYKIFSHYEFLLDEMDYLFYMDVDMAVVADVNENILPSSGLVAVRHPGFYGKGGWGSSNNSQKSTSYLPLEKRTKYYAGGFQGGTAYDYLKACSILHENIKTDEAIGIMAEWHDETHWNWLLNNENTLPPHITELTPEYCMVEELHKRVEWKIDRLTPRIVALAKNHAELRS